MLFYIQRWVKQSLFPFFWILGCYSHPSGFIVKLQSHPPDSQSHDGSAQPKRSRFVLTCLWLLTTSQLSNLFLKVGDGEIQITWTGFSWMMKWNWLKFHLYTKMRGIEALSPPHGLLLPSCNFTYHQTPPGSIILANVLTILFRIVAEEKQVGDVLL